MQGISIVTLNIALDKFYPRVIPFLVKLKPDVILLQEVYKDDVSFLENSLQMQGVYTGSVNLHENRLTKELGIMTCTNLPIIKSKILYYAGTSVMQTMESNATEEIAKMSRALILISIEKDGKLYNIANTHFTWSPDGKPILQQKIDCQNMLNLLSATPDVILCGDFNSPRGTEIFTVLADRYKDNIPATIKSTLDKNLHRIPNLELVIDGIFSSVEYHVTNVSVISDLSDHCAVAAYVHRIDIV